MSMTAGTHYLRCVERYFASASLIVLIGSNALCHGGIRHTKSKCYERRKGSIGPFGDVGRPDAVSKLNVSVLLLGYLCYHDA